MYIGIMVCYLYWCSMCFALQHNWHSICSQCVAATADIRLHADSSTMTVGVGQHSRKLITMHWSILNSKSNNLFHTSCPSLSTLMTTNYVLPFLFSTRPYETHFVYMWSHESDWKPVSAPPIPTGTTGHALSPR